MRRVTECLRKREARGERETRGKCEKEGKGMRQGGSYGRRSEKARNGGEREAAVRASEGEKGREKKKEVDFGCEQST